MYLLDILSALVPSSFVCCCQAKFEKVEFWDFRLSVNQPVTLRVSCCCCCCFLMLATFLFLTRQPRTRELPFLLHSFSPIFSCADRVLGTHCNFTFWVIWLVFISFLLRAGLSGFSQMFYSSFHIWQ